MSSGYQLDLFYKPEEMSLIALLRKQLLRSSFRSAMPQRNSSDFHRELKGQAMRQRYPNFSMELEDRNPVMDNIESDAVVNSSANSEDPVSLSPVSLVSRLLLEAQKLLYPLQRRASSEPGNQQMDFTRPYNFRVSSYDADESPKSRGVRRERGGPDQREVIVGGCRIWLIGDFQHIIGQEQKKDEFTFGVPFRTNSHWTGYDDTFRVRRSAGEHLRSFRTREWRQKRQLTRPRHGIEGPDSSPELRRIEIILTQHWSSGAAGEGQSCAVAAHLAYFLIERQLGSVRRDALLSGLAGAQLLTWTSSPRPFAQAAAGTPTGHALEQSGAELRNFFFQTGNLSPASGLLGELDSAGLVAKADSYSRWHSSSNGPHQATSRLAQDSAAWSRLDTDSRLPPQPAGRLNEATAAGQASSRRGEADKERRRPDRRGVLFNGSINRHKSPLLPTLWIALTLLVLASDVLC